MKKINQALSVVVDQQILFIFALASRKLEGTTVRFLAGDLTGAPVFFCEDISLRKKILDGCGLSVSQKWG